MITRREKNINHRTKHTNVRMCYSQIFTPPGNDHISHLSREVRNIIDSKVPFRGWDMWSKPPRLGSQTTVVSARYRSNSIPSQPWSRWEMETKHLTWHAPWEWNPDWCIMGYNGLWNNALIVYNWVGFHPLQTAWITRGPKWSRTLKFMDKIHQTKWQMAKKKLGDVSREVQVNGYFSFL